MRKRYPILLILVVLAVCSAGTTARAQCQGTAPTFVPFSSLSTYGVVGPDAAGDYLIIGNISGPINYSLVPLPNAVNQQFCSTIPLLQSSTANYFSYVPTAAERLGDFSAFATQLSGISGFPYPSGLFAPDATIWGWRVPAGEGVFVSNNTGGQVLRIDGNIGLLPGPSGNVPGLQLISTGPACEVSPCFQPKDMVVGPDNKLYIADTNDDAIFRMDLTGANVESILSCTGSPCPVTPRALAFSGSSAEDLYFADGGADSTNNVFKIASAGATPVGGPFANPSVVVPSTCPVSSTFCTDGDELDHGLAFDANDNLIFGDLTANSIWTVPPPYNASLSTLASVNSPTGIALNKGTGQAFVISGGVSGGDILPIGSSTPYYAFTGDTPANMVFDAAGRLYVTTEQPAEGGFFGRLWRIDPVNGSGVATLVADLNSLIVTELIQTDEALGVALPGTSGPSETATLSGNGGSFTLSWDGGKYTFGVTYPAGMFPDGSAAIVTPTETSEAAWALRTPLGNPFFGTQIAPVAGENGNGIIFSASCMYQGSLCPVLSTSLSYTTSTTWKSSQLNYCQLGPGLLKADPIGSNNWVNTLTSCTVISSDPTYGTKGTTTCTSSSCLSDWADVFGIAYVFNGFASPVSNTDVNVVKAGQAVPVVFQLLYGNGNPVLNLTMPPVSISSGTIPCATGTPTSTVDSTATGNSGFQNLGGGNYQFNWATQKGWSGTCRQLQVNVGDGNVHTANFQFK